MQKKTEKNSKFKFAYLRHRPALINFRATSGKRGNIFLDKVIRIINELRYYDIRSK